MTYKKFTDTAHFIQKSFIEPNGIKDAVFIKDFKPANDEYFGSNVDVLCLSAETADALASFLDNLQFKREKISFEYDKTMFFPPENRNDLTKVHIYPHMSWYTVKFRFWQNELSDHLARYQDFSVIKPALEVPLLIFHAYFEDRLMRAYDVRQIQSLIKDNSLSSKDYKQVVSAEYANLFQSLLKQVEGHDPSKPIKYTGFVKQMKFVFSTNNLARHKVYYLAIHTAKKLRLIRG